MVSTGVSRFALLKNFGDSDDEEDSGWKKAPVAKSKVKPKSKPQAIASTKQPGEPSLSLPVGLSSFVVPNAPHTGAQKKKKKKTAKSESKDDTQAKQELEEDDELKEALMVSKLEVEQMNRRWLEEERDTKAALKLSIDDTQPTAAKKKEPKKSSERISKSPSTETEPETTIDQTPVQSILRQCEDEVRRLISGDSQATLDPLGSVIAAVYKTKLEECAKDNEKLKTQVDQLQKELATTKDRNKKLCRVLGDGETMEKAKILVQLEKTESVRDDLTKEVSELTAHLEQAKSRIHELEMELKKAHQVLAKPHPHQK